MTASPATATRFRIGWTVRLGVSTLVLAVIAVSGATLEVGLPKLAGNREGMGEMPGWAGRATCSPG